MGTFLFLPGLPRSLQDSVSASGVPLHRAASARVGLPVRIRQVPRDACPRHSGNPSIHLHTFKAALYFSDTARLDGFKAALYFSDTARLDGFKAALYFSDTARLDGFKAGLKQHYNVSNAVYLDRLKAAHP